MAIYRIVCLAVLNHVSFKASKVLIALFAIDLGAKPFAIGTLFAMYAVFPFLLAVRAGRLSDRIGTRLPVLVGTAGLITGLLLPYALPGLAALYCSAALIGAFYIFHVVAMQHLIGAIGGAGDRTRNYSVYSLGIAVAGFAGPLAAGYSIDAVGHARTYLHLALLPLVPLLAWLALPRLIPSAHAQARAARPSGNSALLGNPALRRTLLIGGIIETGLELYTFYLPIYGRSIGLSATAIGAIMGAYAIAALAVRVAMPALVRMANEERVIAYSLALSAATYALFPYIRAPWLLALVSVVLGMGLGAGSPLSMVLTYNRSPDGRSGEALGLRQSVNKLTETCMPMLFGAIASMFGMGPVFWSSAALLAGGAYVLRGPRG